MSFGRTGEKKPISAVVFICVGNRFPYAGEKKKNVIFLLTSRYLFRRGNNSKLFSNADAGDQSTLTNSFAYFSSV